MSYMYSCLICNRKYHTKFGARNCYEICKAELRRKSKTKEEPTEVILEFSLFPDKAKAK